MKDFNPDKVIDLWWQSKTRRPNQKGRHCTTHNTVGDTSDDDSDPETECFEMLEEWDHLALCVCACVCVTNMV